MIQPRQMLKTRRAYGMTCLRHAVANDNSRLLREKNDLGARLQLQTRIISSAQRKAEFERFTPRFALISEQSAKQRELRTSLKAAEE